MLYKSLSFHLFADTNINFNRDIGYYFIVCRIIDCINKFSVFTNSYMNHQCKYLGHFLCKQNWFCLKSRGKWPFSVHTRFKMNTFCLLEVLGLEVKLIGHVLSLTFKQFRKENTIQCICENFLTPHCIDCHYTVTISCTTVLINVVQLHLQSFCCSIRCWSNWVCYGCELLSQMALSCFQYWRDFIILFSHFR